MALQITRPPQTDDELWHWVRAVWGVTLPRQRVCPGHQAPFEAFANAFFARSPVSIWKGSRGFGGKSFMLGCLALTEAVALGSQVTVLGGSAQQSLNVHEHTQSFWYSPRAPKALLEGNPTQYRTKLTTGAWILALLASQTSVRGPHPQRLRLDEIDEMELEILESAQGQPMMKNGIKAQTVMSSTHQYPDRTMSAMLKRAGEKSWPVYSWCWRETSNPVDGWLTAEEVEQKRAEVSDKMFAIEYDLQEPSFGGRAIATELVDWCFSIERGEYRGDLDENIILEPYDSQGTYITGVDWAKETDFTVVRTFRSDVHPWREVAFLRTGRKPWPLMVRNVEDRLAQYKGLLVHDATGLGDVLDDLIDYPRRLVRPVVMRGRDREAMFTEYISGIEQRALLTARIDYPYSEHKFATFKDLYTSGGHPPDSFVAGAAAWFMRNKRNHPEVAPISIPRSTGTSPWAIDSVVPTRY